MTTLELAIEAIGWSGAALILMAYLLLSMGKLTGQSTLYQWMNVVGAASGAYQRRRSNGLAA